MHKLLGATRTLLIRFDHEQLCTMVRSTPGSEVPPYWKTEKKGKKASSSSNKYTIEDHTPSCDERHHQYISHDIPLHTSTMCRRLRSVHSTVLCSSEAK